MIHAVANLSLRRAKLIEPILVISSVIVVRYVEGFRESRGHSRGRRPPFAGMATMPRAMPRASILSVRRGVAHAVASGRDFPGRGTPRTPRAASADGATHESCVLAVDVGTTALKAMLLAADGTAVATAERGYRGGTITGGGANLSGAVEQDPEEWLEAFGGALRDMGFASCAPPAAIALSGQMQDVCLVAGGRSVRPALLYSDVRAVTEAEHVTRALGGAEATAASLSNFKSAAGCLAKWLWLERNEPASLRAAERMVLGAHSFLAYALTDGAAVACDPTTASTTGLLTPVTASTDGDVLAPRWALASDENVRRAFPEIDPEMLPDLIVGAAPDPVGEVSAAAAERLGLAPSFAGVPVFHGVGDLASTTIGAIGGGGSDDASGPGAYLYLGTSGWIATCAPWRETLQNETPNDGVFRLLHPSRPRRSSRRRWRQPGQRRVCEEALLPPARIPSPRSARLCRRRSGARDFIFLISTGNARRSSTLPRAGIHQPFARELEGDEAARCWRASRTTTERSRSARREDRWGGRFNADANRRGWSALGVVDTDARGRHRGSARRRPRVGRSDGRRERCAAGAFQRLGMWGSRGSETPFDAAPRGYFPDGGDVEVIRPDPDAMEKHARNYEVFVKLHDALKNAGAGKLVT